MLETLGESKLPVRIYEIAKRYAHIQRDRLPSDVSGMLIPAPEGASKRWIIVINKDHSIERQRFSMAHELGHLVLHEYRTPHADGVRQVRYRDTESSRGTDRDEIEANQFAAEILLPTKLIVPKLQELGLDTWDGEANKRITGAVEDLAVVCQVSQQALLLRIGNLLHRDERY
ncbi:MAG: ImmA/IrrE family metallo-endopeptidase [Gemmatimonadales bacterium]|nr:ImmA/IrrE family metallo-endopeptidase [Gemmatimonadales bacterium]